MSSYINSLISKHKNCDIFKKNVLFRNNNINMLQTVQQQSLPRQSLNSFLLSIPFVNMQNTINACRLTLPIGLWIITFGFKMSATGSNGNGISNNIVYGLSKLSHNSFDIVKNNSLYNIFYDDVSTYQSFNNTTTLALDTETTIYFNALLDNQLAQVDTLMTNVYINAIKI